MILSRTNLLYILPQAIDGKIKSIPTIIMAIGEMFPRNKAMKFKRKNTMKTTKNAGKYLWAFEKPICIAFFIVFVADSCPINA